MTKNKDDDKVRISVRIDTLTDLGLIASPFKNWDEAIRNIIEQRNNFSKILAEYEKK